MPVEPAVVVDEPGGTVPGAVAPEEEDVAPGDVDRDELGEELRQPRATGPDDDVAGWIVGRCESASLHRDTVPLTVRDEQLSGAPRVQHPGFRLVQHAVQVVDGERREEPARVVGGQPLVRDPEAFQNGDARGLEPVGAPREPRQADAFPDPGLRFPFEVEPERAGA